MPPEALRSRVAELFKERGVMTLPRPIWPDVESDEPEPPTTTQETAMDMNAVQRRINELVCLEGSLGNEDTNKGGVLSLGARTGAATAGVALTPQEEALIRSHGISPVFALRGKIKDELAKLRSL